MRAVCVYGRCCGMAVSGMYGYDKAREDRSLSVVGWWWCAGTAAAAAGRLMMREARGGGPTGRWLASQMRPSQTLEPSSSCGRLAANPGIATNHSQSALPFISSRPACMHCVRCMCRQFYIGRQCTRRFHIQCSLYAFTTSSLLTRCGLLTIRMWRWRDGFFSFAYSDSPSSDAFLLRHQHTPTLSHHTVQPVRIHKAKHGDSPSSICVEISDSVHSNMPAT